MAYDIDKIKVGVVIYKKKKKAYEENHKELP